MFSIGYGDVGEDDKAASFFSRGYSQNSLGAFHDWHEVVGASGANNFITGAGGFMQSVWAGYGGVRFVNGALRLQRPRQVNTITKHYPTGIYLVESKGDPDGVHPLHLPLPPLVLGSYQPTPAYVSLTCVHGSLWLRCIPLSTTTIGHRQTALLLR